LLLEKLTETAGSRCLYNGLCRILSGLLFTYLWLPLGADEVGIFFDFFHVANEILQQECCPFSIDLLSKHHPKTMESLFSIQKYIAIYILARNLIAYYMPSSRILVSLVELSYQENLIKRLI
jgi:hypothetical protein